MSKVENRPFEEAYFDLLTEERIALFEEELENPEKIDELLSKMRKEEVVFMNKDVSVIRPLFTKKDGPKLYYVVPTDKNKSKIKVVADPSNNTLEFSADGKELSREEFKKIANDLKMSDFDFGIAA